MSSFLEPTDDFEFCRLESEYIKWLDVHFPDETKDFPSFENWYDKRLEDIAEALSDEDDYQMYA